MCYGQFSYLCVWLLLVLDGVTSSSVNDTANITTTMLDPAIVLKKAAKYTLQGKSAGAKYMSEIGSRCTEDGFFPDKEDCRKFHVCFSGTQSIRRCKEGMLWDETKVGCSSQNGTVCADGRKKWGRDESDVAKSIKSNYTCRPGASGLFADPSSCSIYHWCVVGILHSTHLCAPGLHFSAGASGCVLPKDAECEGQIAPPYSSIECSLGSSGYFPDPYDCSVFHYCDAVRIRSEALLCSAGRVWSARLENCAWPHEVPECQNLCPPTYTSQMRFSDPAICSQYVQCVDGSLQPRTCPTHFLFDRISKTCKPYDQAECHGDKPGSLPVTLNAPFDSPDFPDANSISNEVVIKKQRSTPFNCIVDGYYGDPHDCRVYHVCVDERDYRSMCAPGLHWESLLRLCMPAHLVGCQKSKSIESSAGAPKKNWLQLFTRSVVKTTTITTISTVPSIFTCAGRANGYYPDPVHCHKFHYCGTGWHSVMECDKGLAYSTRDHECLPLELAKCTPEQAKSGS